MALRYFYRLAAGTLDPTHDYTAGTTTTTEIGTGGTFNTTAGLGGETGLHVATNLQGGRATSAGAILSPATVDGVTQPLNLVLSTAWSFRCIGGTSFQSFQRDFGFKINSTVSNELFGVVAGLSPAKLALRLRSSISGSQQTLDLTLSNTTIAADQWYGVVIRLDVPNDNVRIELYTHDGTYGGEATLVEAVEDTATALDNYIVSNIVTTSAALVFLAQAGTHDAHPVVLDNWMISTDYNEPLQDNLTKSSYTLYGSSPIVSVSASLKELDGVTNLPTDLSGVRWAWFDTVPGVGQSVPIDYGTALSIQAGSLDLDLPNSTLTNGQYGFLVLEHVASGRRQAYRLQVSDSA